MKRILILGLLFITACSAVYETNYTFVPPKDSAGRECSNRCIVKKDKCYQACRQDHTTNKIIDDISNFITGSKKHDSTSRKKTSCKSSCDVDHRNCHSNCGGKVIENKECIAFCD